MALEDGVAIFGAWILILEIAAKCKTRGTLGELSESGPIEYGPGELAIMTGCPSSLFTRALEVLTSPIVGWISQDSSEKALSALGERSESSNLQEKTREDSTSQERTEQNKTRVASRGKPHSARSVSCDSEYLEELQAKPAYAELNVAMVHGKMVAWCELKGKQPTRARLLNWLNREDRPLSGNGAKSYTDRVLDEQERLYESYGNQTPKDEPLH